MRSLLSSVLEGLLIVHRRRLRCVLVAPPPPSPLSSSVFRIIARSAQCSRVVLGMNPAVIRDTIHRDSYGRHISRRHCDSRRRRGDSKQAEELVVASSACLKSA
jgi:hypothetical protein